MADTGRGSLRKIAEDKDDYSLSIEQEFRKKSSVPLLRKWVMCMSPTRWTLFGFALGCLMVLFFWQIGRPATATVDLRQLTALKSSAMERTKNLPKFSSLLPSGDQEGSHRAPQTTPSSDRSTFSGLLADRAQNNKIILTVATSSFQRLTLNLLCSLDRLGITNFIVGALDEPTYSLFKSLGHPVFQAYEKSILGGEEVQSAWDRRVNFRRVNVVKEEIIVWALEAGYQVILTDGDIIWLRNPFEDLAQRCTGFDYCFQTAIVDEVGDCQLNGGFINVMPTTAAITAQKMLVVILSENLNFGDQQELRKMLCDGAKRTSGSTCEDSITGAKTKMLPASEYAKSAVLFNVSDTDYALQELNPFTIHYNNGLPEAKEKIMVKQGLWILDDDNKCLEQAS